MLLHKSGKEINEANVKKVADAVGLKVEDAQIKALVAALDGVNIDEEIEKASKMQVAAPVAAESSEKKEAKKEAKKEEKSADEAASGLSTLFG